jgi:ABC-type sugar transport system ATPase subunit
MVELKGVTKRWRVAFGKALLLNPKVFLFDDTLSGLAPKDNASSLRIDMGKELSDVLRRFGATAIYATCDQDADMTSLADRIISM